MSKTWYLESRGTVPPAAEVKVIGDNIPDHLLAFSYKELPKRRAELRRLSLAGAISEIVFQAVVYRHVPNANNLIIPTEELSKFAPSFKGQPFLQDHDQYAISSRLGTIGKSILVEGKTKSITQAINVTSSEGIAAFIDGKIDRFSIGWASKQAICSFCNEDAYSCPHWPGQKYEGKVCSVIFRDVTGVETSAVNRPAVPGTGLLQQFLSEVKMKKGTVPDELDTSPDEEELDTNQLSDDGDSNRIEAELEAFQEALGINDITAMLTQALARIDSLESQLSQVNERVAEIDNQPVLTQLVNSIKRPKAPATVPGHVPTSKETGTSERVPFRSQSQTLTNQRAARFMAKISANREG